MKTPDSASPPALRVGRYALTLAAAWTVVVAGVLVWALLEQRREALESARIQARHGFEKDLVYRRWAAGHAGVYVPVTEEKPPNPYLAHIQNRDVTTTSGLKLTLVNPAYMTRQVLELGLEQYGHQGHITSLNSLRPKNAPDPWETEALNAFEHGKAEVASLELSEGRSTCG